MKKKLPPFVAGMLTTAIIGSFTISALAAAGQLTITVDPINIQVNGATFAPKDAQGASVPVFAYNGTTYAPLRALAEAYGLEVGYDQEKNMATVGEKASDPATTPTPDTTVPADYSDWTAEEEAAYQEFKGMWEVTDNGGKTNDEGQSVISIFSTYQGAMDDVSFVSYFRTLGEDLANQMFNRFCQEIIQSEKYLRYDVVFFSFVHRAHIVGGYVRMTHFPGGTLATTVDAIEKKLSRY